MAGFPRIAIRCKNPQCQERGRVLAETDGARLYFGDVLYVERAQTFYCRSCNWRVVWQPHATSILDIGARAVVDLLTE